MKEVTDQDLIDKLEAQEVSAPEVLSQLNSGASSRDSSLLSIANDQILDFILGAGAGIQKPFYEAGNIVNQMLGLGRIEPPGADQGTVGALLGNIVGETAGFIGGGEALDAARMVSKSVPYVSKIAGALEGSLPRNITKRAIGSSLYGALMSPDDRTEGALIGGIASPVTEIAGTLMSKAMKQVKPSEVVKQLQSMLSPSSINARKEIGSNSFRDIFKVLPKEDIYKNIPLRIVAQDSAVAPVQSYLNLTERGIATPSIEEFIPHKLKLAHENFLRNKTPENAHTLYKQFGTEIGKYNTMEAKAGTLDAVSNKLKETFGVARSAIKDDLLGYMNSKNPVLRDKFLEANKYYHHEVYPYEQLSLALRSLGKKPSADKVLKTLSKKESLASDITERTGRDQHFPKSVSEALPVLEKRIKTRDLAQRGAGMLLGGALGAHFAPTMELAGGAAGLYLAPMLSKLADGIIPSKRLPVNLSDILRKALLANLSSGGQ